ncbi:MAG: hypothetical protein EA351_02930 [Gemmatimonadales bacterium]|nr:MAG: hypothetical protein EA351_02930 [Gemmatimonadales bacterium]
MSRLRSMVLMGPLALLLVLSGCALFYQSPEVRITDMRVVGLGLTSGTAEIDVEVDNPNRFAIEVRGLEYLLEVSDGAARARWDTLATGFSADTVRIARRSTDKVTLQIPFRYQALGVAFRSWLEGGQIPYRIEGEVRARGPGGQRDLPFQSQGQFSP